MRKEIGAEHLDRFRPIAGQTTDEETGRVLVGVDTWKDKVRIFPDSVRAKQPPATSIIQHLDHNRKAKAWSIPLFAAQLGLKNLLDHLDRNQALKTMKSNERARSRQTAPGTDLKTVRTAQLTNEARTLRVEKIKTTKRLPHGAPESPVVFTELVDTVLAALNKKLCG